MKYVVAFTLLILLINCNSDQEPEDCRISECGSWAYAIVNAETNHNLVGYDRMFNPDEVTFLDEQGEEIYFKTRYKDWADWWEFSFNYHDLVRRCDLHNTDSTFIIRIFVQLNEEDTDTLDHRIAPCRDFDAVLYNGNEDIKSPTESFDGLNPAGLSSFFLRKTIN